MTSLQPSLCTSYSWINTRSTRWSHSTNNTVFSTKHGPKTTSPSSSVLPLLQAEDLPLHFEVHVVNTNGSTYASTINNVYENNSMSTVFCMIILHRRRTWYPVDFIKSKDEVRKWAAPLYIRDALRLDYKTTSSAQALHLSRIANSFIVIVWMDTTCTDILQNSRS